MYAIAVYLAVDDQPLLHGVGEFGAELQHILVQSLIDPRIFSDLTLLTGTTDELLNDRCFRYPLRAICTTAQPIPLLSYF